jgi:glyoxylase-like metal-dependent hydrolase (beta-lactamase superfamily II)
MPTWKIGDVSITHVVELQLPGLNFVIPDAVPEKLRTIPWLKAPFVNEDWEAIACIQTFVIESQGQRVIVDTCVGNDKRFRLKHWNDRSGPYLEDLTESGFPTDSIDTVLCTHLHADHVGWNTVLTDGKWTPTFPGADYLFGRVEWDHFKDLDEEQANDVREQSVQPIVDANLHTLVETNHKITDEVWLEPTPGHTPGHVSVHIKSGDKEAIITGDCIHHPSQMAHPEWTCAFDRNSTQAESTRRSFLDQYAETPTLIIGTHFAAASAGHIVRDGDVYRFEV